jgi:hypothetical protein
VAGEACPGLEGQVMIFGFGKKYFASVDEAKNFLMTRIVQEAQIQGAPFSENERKFLGYSPTEPSSEWGLDLQSLPADTVEERYESEYLPRLARILNAALKRDKDSNPDPDETKRYHSAAKVLEDEDYVIADIARRAFK